MEHDNVSSINEKEVMDFYGLKGNLGKLSLRLKILRSWILHKFAFGSIISPKFSLGKESETILITVGSFE